MCLYVKNGQQLEVAERDFTVYKVMKQVSDNKWQTPFRGFMIKNIVENVTTIKPKWKSVQRTQSFVGYDIIEGGFIYGVQTSLLAKDIIKELKSAYTNENPFYIWQMTIPKGTEYIVGKYGEIGAKKMIFKKMLKMK